MSLMSVSRVDLGNLHGVGCHGDQLSRRDLRLELKWSWEHGDPGEGCRSFVNPPLGQHPGVARSFRCQFRAKQIEVVGQGNGPQVDVATGVKARPQRDL